MKRLFVREGPGAGLVGKPVRLSALVSFRGEKRTLGERELGKLVRELVERAARETREAPLDEGELAAVAGALQRTLRALGDLDLDDVEAVRLGPRGAGRAAAHTTSVPRTLVEQSRQLDQLNRLTDVLGATGTTRAGRSVTDWAAPGAGSTPAHTRTRSSATCWRRAGRTSSSVRRTNSPC